MESENKKLKILILDQGRQALPFMKSFAKAGHETIVVCSTRLSECYFSRYPSRRLIWPSYVKDRPAFENKLREYLKENSIDVTISVGDITADILSGNKEEFLQYTHLTSPDYPLFIQAADKLNLMNYCMEKSLPCPKSYELNEQILASLNTLLSFPVIVKPTRGVGAIGVVKFNDYEDLLSAFPEIKKNHGEELIVQEFIPQEGGMQYQAEAFVDDNGKMKVCMVILKPRFFPVSGGTSTANLTIDHPEIEKTSRKLLEGLKWRGAADIDYILDPRDGTAKILEINPRVTAGIKIGFAAGIDYAELHLKLALGKEIPEITKYKLGVYCRNFFLDTLWFIFSDRKMKKNTTPSFYKFFGKNVYDQIFSFDDPLAGLGFFLHMLKKYLNLSNFRRKFFGH